MAWTVLDTNTHQDHVIAHVIGATPIGHFVWDETAYLLLDIGFIWNIYLDLEMGLVPQRVAIAELEADHPIRVDELLQNNEGEAGPIESVEAFEDGDKRLLQLNCESGRLLIETSLTDRWTRIENG
jgi:hypothetical protein